MIFRWIRERLQDRRVMREVQSQVQNEVRYWEGYGAAVGECVGSHESDETFEVTCDRAAQYADVPDVASVDPFDRGWRDGCSDALVLFSSLGPDWVFKRRTG